jgi:hypothetical protein
MQRRVARVPIEVNPSKLCGAISDEATKNGSNLAAEAGKRNQTQGELIRGLILASQLAYSSPHHKMKSEIYRVLFVTDTSSPRHAPESEQYGTQENCNLQFIAAGQYWSAID